MRHLRYDDAASLRRFALCAEQVCTDLGNLCLLALQACGLMPIASAAVSLINLLQCRHFFRDPIVIQETCPDETFTVAALCTVSDLQNSWQEVSALQQHFVGDTGFCDIVQEQIQGSRH